MRGLRPVSPAFYNMLILLIFREGQILGSRIRISICNFELLEEGVNVGCIISTGGKASDQPGPRKYLLKYAKKQ